MKEQGKSNTVDFSFRDTQESLRIQREKLNKLGRDIEQFQADIRKPIYIKIESKNENK